MSARRSIFALAALAPSFAGCGVAAYVMPHGTRMQANADGTPCVDECWLPPDAELSCVEFAVEGSEVSPPLPIEENSVLERGDPGDETPMDTERENLPLTGPATASNDASAIESDAFLEGEEGLPPPLAERLTPAPVMMETEEEALAAQGREPALALEAARYTVTSRLRQSTDVTVGLRPDPVEHDPGAVPPLPNVVPLRPPAPGIVSRNEPVYADYVHAPLSKLAWAIRSHGRPHDGRIVRPGLVGGLRHRLFGDREPPEPVPFVVYERVAPKFFPVPTRPAFESAQASFVATAPVGTLPQRPALMGFAPPGMAPPPAPVSEPPPPPPEEETLPRPLPAMEALPVPQPDPDLPPAPRLDE